MIAVGHCISLSPMFLKRILIKFLKHMEKFQKRFKLLYLEEVNQHSGRRKEVKGHHGRGTLNHLVKKRAVNLLESKKKEGH